MFDTLRFYAHKRYLGRLKYDEVKFREELEIKILV